MADFPTAIPSQNDNWDYMASSTMYAYSKKLVDNVFDKTPLLEFLKPGVQNEPGGYTIVRPVMTAEAFSGDIQAIDPYDAVTVTEDTQGFTAAEYRWRQIIGSLAISGAERHRNTGERQVFNLLKAKVRQLELTLAQKFNVYFYGDPAIGAKTPQGLAAIVSDGNPTRANLGGIDATTSTWWQSTVEDTTEALALARMSNLYNTLSVFGEHPDRIFTTQALWEKYESLLQPQLRYSDAKVADAGFQNLIFKSVPIVWDPDCQAGTLYMLNSKYVNVVVDDNVWMKSSPFFTRPDRDQENRYLQNASYCELVTDHRRAHGKLTNKS